MPSTRPAGSRRGTSSRAGHAMYWPRWIRSQPRSRRAGRSGRGTAEARSVQAAVERRGRARGGAAAPEDENPARRLRRDPCALGVERSLHPRRAHVAADAEQCAAVTAELDRIDAALAEPLPPRGRFGLEPRAARPQAVRHLADPRVTGAVGIPGRTEHQSDPHSSQHPNQPQPSHTHDGREPRPSPPPFEGKALREVVHEERDQDHDRGGGADEQRHAGEREERRALAAAAIGLRDHVLNGLLRLLQGIGHGCRIPGRLGRYARAAPRRARAGCHTVDVSRLGAVVALVAAFACSGASGAVAQQPPYDSLPFAPPGALQGRIVYQAPEGCEFGSYDLATGKDTRLGSGRCDYGVLFSRDGGLAAWRGLRDRVQVVDVATGARLWLGPGAPEGRARAFAYPLFFSPDSSRLAYCVAPRVTVTTVVSDARTGAVRGRVRGTCAVAYTARGIAAVRKGAVFLGARRLFAPRQPGRLAPGVGAAVAANPAGTLLAVVVRRSRQTLELD